MRVCIYCEAEKQDSEFSLEHIFPDSLGGAQAPDLFKTRDVCERCNNISGIYVDGAFIKNWFSTNEAASACQEYLDINSPNSVATLSFLGLVDDVPLDESEVCELWIAPCGVVFYHIHRRDEPRWDAYAGGDFTARRKHPGRVYIKFTTSQLDWVHLTLRTAVAYFPKAKRYAPGIDFNWGPGVPEFLHQMDSAASDEAALFFAANSNKTKNIIDPAFEERFMTKFALGMGYKIFGANFLTSEYAKKLRRAFREKSSTERAKLQIRGAGFLQANYNQGSGGDSTAKLLGWRGAYTIRMQVVDKSFVLSLHLPSASVMHLVVADDPALWQGEEFAKYREGVVYLSVPELAQFVGPVAFPQYLSHRMGISRASALDDLEALRIDPTTLPPCR